MKPKISVIVPVYNVERFLSKCLDSIINQTYENLEIILVNDGSPDNCGLICDEYAEKDNRITVIHKKNKGISSARNSGLNIATGEYIGFVDSDDWIHKKMFEDLITITILNQSNLVHCLFTNSNEIIEKVQEKNVNPIILDKKETLYNYLNYGFYVWRNLYSKKLIGELRFDENTPFVEDMFFGMDIVEKIDQSIFINLPYYLYNDDNDKALTRVKYNKNTFLSLEANCYIQKKVFNLFPQDTELNMLIKDRIIENCIYHLQILNRKDRSHIDKDNVLKRKAKQVYNDNFTFFKKPSAHRTIIRMLSLPLLKYFYLAYFTLNKMN